MKVMSLHGYAGVASTWQCRPHVADAVGAAAAVVVVAAIASAAVRRREQFLPAWHRMGTRVCVGVCLSQRMDSTTCTWVGVAVFRRK